MSRLDIISTWKDDVDWRSLSKAESALLPAHQAELIEFWMDQLAVRSGALAISVSLRGVP